MARSIALLPMLLLAFAAEDAVVSARRWNLDTRRSLSLNQQQRSPASKAVRTKCYSMQMSALQHRPAMCVVCADQHGCWRCCCTIAGAQEQARSSDISAQHDQQPGYAAHAAGTGLASVSARDAPLALAQCRAGVAGGVVWAAVLKVIKVNRRAGEQLQALVVLDDGSTQRPALVELGDRRRALQQLVEGHVLLLVGAQAVLVSQLSPQQQKMAMFAFTGDAKQAAATAGDGSQEILLWRESAQASLYDVSALPGILNSPALHQRLSLHEAAAAAEALAQRRADAVQGQACAGGHVQAPPTLCTGDMPGSFVCCVHLAEADIHTQRVHM